MNKPIFVVMPNSSAASGRRCMNASPSIAPAEKLRKYISIFFSVSAFMDKVNIPTSDIMLTSITLTKVYII